MGGEGEEHITKQPPLVEVQERGEIFFFYRPKVNLESPHSIDDIQRMYLVLRPTSGEKKVEEKQSSDSGKEGNLKERKEVQNRESEQINADEAQEQHITGEETKVSGKRINSSNADGHSESKKIKTYPDEEQDEKTRKAGGHGTETEELSKTTLLRLIVIGRKSLPDLSKRNRPFWAFVELVSTDSDDLKQVLSSEEYEAKTTGNRTRPGSRPFGEGNYQIVRHQKDGQMHTHLVYKLVLPGPEKSHKAQEALNVKPEASYLIQIKNPQHGAPLSAGLQNRRKADFPEHLLEKFGPYRFLAADPPDLLNYEGCEFILIGASDDIEEELGLEVDTKDVGHPECSDVLNFLQDFEKEVKAPIVPLIDGEWA